MPIDYFMNGSAHGSMAEKLLACGMDTGILRPWIGADGRTYMTVNEGGKPRNVCVNATATLRYDDWKTIDRAVLRVARNRLRVVNAIRGAGLRYSIGGGMGTTVLVTEAQSDPGEAMVSMDGVRRHEEDRPIFETYNLPLPITHVDFSFTIRQIDASRRGGSPLDTTMAEAAARRVAETIETLTLGNNTSFDQFAYGGGTIYGLSDAPDVNTKSLTTPDGTNGETVVDEFLDMRKTLHSKNMYGPYFCFVAPSWDQYLDKPFYITNTGLTGNTLRDQIGQIDGIDRPMTIDNQTTKTVILAQKTPDVIRMVDLIDIRTVQWESHGGFQINFKVFGIIVPQARSDIEDQSGVMVGTYT